MLNSVGWPNLGTGTIIWGKGGHTSYSDYWGGGGGASWSMLPPLLSIKTCHIEISAVYREVSIDVKTKTVVNRRSDNGTFQNTVI